MTAAQPREAPWESFKSKGQVIFENDKPEIHRAPLHHSHRFPLAGQLWGQQQPLGPQQLSPGSSVSSALPCLVSRGARIGLP